MADINSTIDTIINVILTNESERDAITAILRIVLETNQISSFDDLINTIETGDSQIEPEIELNKVNFLTMHRAKGLTADIVFVLGAEDEHIPGKHEIEPDVGDERRLLYVSLTRAKHQLYITYCSNRDGQQMNLGRSNGKSRRTLTRFLQNSMLKSKKGDEFVSRKIIE